MKPSTPSTQIDIAEALAPGAGIDAFIDARSPAEFAEDHLPGALNWPVLDDAERHQVGTLYASSPFEARKLGAALVARNMARHIEAHAAQFGKGWRPLVYCWRGGQRSLALQWCLGQIGWRALQLRGGYRAYRTHVRSALEALPATLHYRLLAGRTGTGKTRLLQTLAAQGAQVLDLEALACHRGSLLGAVPGCAQPTQKGFDSLLWQQLRTLDPTRPVYVESESRKIGQLRLPESLYLAMRACATAYWVEMPVAARVELLLQDYSHFFNAPEQLCELLAALAPLRGHERVRHWQAQVRAGEWTALLHGLVAEHYDPGYDRSLLSHFELLSGAQKLLLQDGSAASLDRAAHELQASDKP